MRRLLLLLPLLSGCGIPSPFTDSAPMADIPPVCRDAVYADPEVKRLLAASAGSETFRTQNAERLRYAKIAAAHRCLQARGMSRGGGGVEAPTIR